MTILDELVNYDVYADNLILGKSLLFTLHLPKQWHLGRGVSHPEIIASHERRNRKWVASGNAWYVVYDSDRRWALEMAATIRPIPANYKTPTGEPVSIGTHPAHLWWKEKRRGLPWQRHTVTFMTLDFDCFPSDRHIRLEFSGWCPPDGFQEILTALRKFRCH